MKRCSRCKQDKARSEFNRNTAKKDGLQNSCRDCKKTYDAEHYSANKQWYYDRNIKRKIDRRAETRALKTKPCTDCGVMYPWYVMDFDHLDPTTKVNDIARMVNHGLAMETIQKEIDKCELVCSNCHRVRTYLRSLASGQIGKVV